MITLTEADRMLGELATESAIQLESEGASSPPRTDYRPRGIALQNDGRWQHWMMPGEDYDIRHDGVGWRVTCRSWGSGHTYRLADAETWQLVDHLPTDAGEELLLEGHTYRLQFAGPQSRWQLVDTTQE